MISLPQLLLRGSQFLWTLLITALVGNVIATAFAGNPSAVNYAIFVAVFSWIAVFYGLVAAFMDGFAIPIVLGALDGLAMLFSLIAGIVLAAELGVHSCGNRAYTSTNHLTDGSFNTGKRCHELQASCAFFWFLWISYVGSLAMDFMGSGSSMSMRRGGGIRKGGPSMSQV